MTQFFKKLCAYAELGSASNILRGYAIGSRIKSGMCGFVVVVATSSFAQAAEPVQLTCKISEVCFEKVVQDAASEFVAEGGGNFKIEVTAKNGASVGFKTEGAENYSSAMQIGPEPVEKTITMQVIVGKSGKFSLNVEPAQIMVDGKLLEENSSYKLKITKVNAAIPASAEGVSI